MTPKELGIILACHIYDRIKDLELLGLVYLSGSKFFHIFRPQIRDFGLAASGGHTVALRSQTDKKQSVAD